MLGMCGGIRPSVGAICRVNSILTCAPYIYGGAHSQGRGTSGVGVKGPGFG